MKRFVLAITMLILSTAVAYAQQPAPPAAAPPPGPAGMPMMEMCREMMAAHGGMMGGGMMAPGMPGGRGGMMDGPGMMGGMMGPGMMGGGDPKMMGHMMEMRGEIMKAVGDIMIKHAQKMQQMATPPK